MLPESRQTHNWTSCWAIFQPSITVPLPTTILVAIVFPIDWEVPCRWSRQHPIPLSFAPASWPSRLCMVQLGQLGSIRLARFKSIWFGSVWFSLFLVRSSWVGSDHLWPNLIWFGSDPIQFSMVWSSLWPGWLGSAQIRFGLVRTGLAQSVVGSWACFSLISLFARLL